jgi:3-hydroxybutyryl-CoA dehydrogenase
MREQAAAQSRSTIAVVGAGLMGHAIALEFALSGYPVRLYDVARERVQAALERARATAAWLAEHGLVAPDRAAAASTLLSGMAELAAAVAGADYVAEAVPEDLEVKRRVYAALDQLCPPEVILASNTSGLLPSALADGLTHPERLLVAHYLNPPYLLPLVEIVPGPRTSPAVVECTVGLLRTIGKRPVVVRREVPGFLANRLQAALYREALALVARGVATVEDIDTVVRDGIGRRLSVLGPFQIMDLAGLDVWHAIGAYLAADLSNTAELPLLAERVAQGALGAKSGRGFYEWPPDVLQTLTARRDRALIQRTRFDAAEAGPEANYA